MTGTYEPIPQVGSAGPVGRRVTRLAFDNRFTQAERVKIDLAGERPIKGELDTATYTETKAEFQTRRDNAAAFRDMRTQVNNATFIDLDRPDTRAGVQRLEQAGILAPGRAAAILDAPVQESERPS